MSKSKESSNNNRKLLTVFTDNKVGWKVSMDKPIPKGQMNKVVKAIWHEWSYQKYKWLRQKRVDEKQK